ncbi:6-pyruvoyl tetrahydropterin synthase [Planctomycetes bacterium Poly30]|uniref:6-carboxy-5,6,7,8-tetrahydropterin synthase n=1 Tax=Saltatorellus ferox TaxID=2528018 RepID=A0A518EYB3_9BACT|nr:6-pyruvoyl tetrahydropterin synthase [Planctomycetes bacterium Poly30]
MYSVTVRDRFMIAHSFSGDIFGPAQALHGATYVTDVTFFAAELDPDGLVVDIGAASEVLSSILEDFNFKNLDDLPEFDGKNTTTEFMAHVVFDRMLARMTAGDLGAAAKAVTKMKVTLQESDVAFASYEREFPPITM